MQSDGGWKKDTAKTCQVCNRWVLQRKSTARLIPSCNACVLRLTLGMEERKGLTSMLVSMTLS